jgi:hypothetical protein
MHREIVLLWCNDVEFSWRTFPCLIVILYMIQYYRDFSEKTQYIESLGANAINILLIWG